MRNRAIVWAIAARIASLSLLLLASCVGEQSLYDDLGGKANIERFVGETLSIAVKDPRIRTAPILRLSISMR